MAVVVYPSTLPGPSLSQVTPAERRLLSDVSGGPQQARGVQRDYLAMQRVEWNLLSAAQADEFNVWWRDTLVQGGSWFTSTWPAPQGWVSVVRRFMGVPQWSHMGGGFWRVSAQVQVRGRGMAPQGCLDELFASGTTPYTLVTGNTGLFTVAASPYGNGLICAAQNTSVVSRISRAFPTKLTKSLSTKFRITVLNPDDGALIGAFDGLVGLSFIPCREAAFDVLRRAYIYVGSDSLPVTDTGLTVDDWYQIDITLISGFGNSLCKITRLADNTIIKLSTLPGDYAALSATNLDFVVDSGGLTSAVQYSDIHLC